MTVILMGGGGSSALQQGRRKQISVGAVMVCAQSAREFFYVTLIIHEQSRMYYRV